MATGNAELQRFIAQDYRVQQLEMADSTEELVWRLDNTKAEVVVLSRYLSVNENPKQIIEHIVNTRPELRVVYLYGQEDDAAYGFIEYLKSKGVTDYYIGTNVSSVDIERMLFGEDARILSGLKASIRKPVRTKFVRELNSAVISIYSNSSNGKSHLAWNLAAAFTGLGYKTALLNLDRGYSANLFYGIQDIYYDLLEYLIANQAHQNILESCFKRGGLHVVAGRLGSEISISTEDFFKLLYFIKSKKDIVIIDSHTGLNDITLQAINNSNIDFLVFDCDLMRFHLNRLMLEQLGGSFIGDKTIAVINNCSAGSEAYKYIYRQVRTLNLGFRSILPLSSCGSLGCDLMHTDKTPYEAAAGSGFHMDLDNILNSINVKNTRSGIMDILKGR